MSEIIAKAMNSTLGTSNFKAFDELMLDNKIIVASDEIIGLFPGGEYYVNSNIVTGATEETASTIATITMPLNGSIKLRYKLWSEITDTRATMVIYIDNIKYISIFGGYGNSSEATESNVIIPANKGAEIELRGYNEKKSGGKTGFCAYLYDIRGSVVETPPAIITVA